MQGQPPYGQPPQQQGYGQPPQGYGQQQPMQGYGAPPPPPGSKDKFTTIMLLIAPSIFGFCGIHRFYTGHIGIGIAQLLTLGGCGIWQLLDLIAIFTGKFKDSEGRPVVGDHPIKKLM